MAARSWVTVSWVATASYRAVESSTRARLPIAPAWPAAARVSSNRRRGRPEARRRLRWPGRTVGWKASAPVLRPAAACQRRSTSKRSQASRSERPSKACRTMAVASTRAATVGRPRAEALYRSAK